MRSVWPFLLAIALIGGCAGAAAPAASSSVAAAYPGWPGPVVDTSAPIVPVIVSSELAVGANRFLFSLNDRQNRALTAPDLPVEVAFFDLAADPARAVASTPAAFIWTIEGERGLYRAPAEFGRAGDWGIEVIAHPKGGPEQRARVVFSVREKSATPAIGAPVPRSETPTATTLGAARKISSDDTPDLDFYRSSAADAVTSGKPSVIVFATPRFCTSRTCGPTLDLVKSIAAPYKDRVTFVHVEVFSNLDTPDDLQVVPAVGEWGLPTEPWVFVVDRAGRLSAKFEGVADRAELVDALDAVSG